MSITCIDGSGGCVRLGSTIVAYISSIVSSDTPLCNGILLRYTIRFLIPVEYSSSGPLLGDI